MSLKNLAPKMTTEQNQVFQATCKAVLNETTFNSLLNKAGKITIPSLLSGNTKLDKAKETNLGLAMLPADMVNEHLKPQHYQRTACPTAEFNNCKNTCLVHSGHYGMKGGAAYKALIKRTIIFRFMQTTFKTLLTAELLHVAALSTINNVKSFIRLDVFTDNKKYNLKFIKEFKAENPLFEKSIQWYDYTKIISAKLFNEAYSLGYILAASETKNNKSDIQALIEGFNDDTANGMPLFIATVKQQVIATEADITGDWATVNGLLFDNFTQHAFNLPHNIGIIELSLEYKGNLKIKDKLIAIY